MQMQKKRKKSILMRFKDCWQLYVLLAIPLAFILIFHYYPMLGAQIAFRKYNYFDGIWHSPWVGFANFTKFFKSSMFERVIRNTLTISLYNLAAGFPLPILFALGLNVITSKRLKKTVQLVSYAPHFISTTVMVGMMLTILQPRTGLYGYMGKFLTGSYPVDLFAKGKWFTHLYVWSDIWQHMGWNAVIYVAALTSVDASLHEAAMIDGANRFQRVLHIDIPAILPTASILLILNAGNVLSVGFEKVYLLQNDINLKYSEIIATYVYKVGLTSGTNFSLSTAIGLFNSVVNMIVLVTVNWISGRLSGNSLF